LIETGYHAYIIPSEDEHQSEYTAKKDQQREWISGFTGSAGIAVVTRDKAAIWSDSRYFLRGDKELNNTEWIFQKSGLLALKNCIQYILNTFLRRSRCANYEQLDHTAAKHN
jgi:Xaa-Pro aminopeptidase